MAVRFAPTPTVRNRKEALSWAIKVAKAIAVALAETPELREAKLPLAKDVRGGDSTMSAEAWCNIDTGMCIAAGDSKQPAENAPLVSAQHRLVAYLRKIHKTYR